MAHKSTVDAYNKIAKEFNTRNSAIVYGKEYQTFKELIGSGNKIIEIGCGTGRDAEELVKLGFDYTGIDASEGMLEIAQEKVKEGKFKIGDFYTLDFLPETFDGFWAAASFLHVPKKDMDIVLSEAYRILKNRGVGFISLKQKTLMDEGVIKETKAGGIERYFAFYEKNEFKNILERNKFEVIDITTVQENDKNQTVWLYYFIRKN
jgi:ubiquinone/menaquinone biosynthesis C-methylase UbiE